MKKLVGYYEAPLGERARARARESAVVSLIASLHKGYFTPSLSMELEPLNLSFYRPRIKMDFISLKTSGSVQAFKIVSSIQAKQSFHNK